MTREKNVTALFAVGLKLPKEGLLSFVFVVVLAYKYNFCLVWYSFVCMLAEGIDSRQGDEIWYNALGHERSFDLSFS